jgi:tetratricopeptide (TPR) repeat protein
MEISHNGVCAMKASRKKEGLYSIADACDGASSFVPFLLPVGHRKSNLTSRKADRLPRASRQPAPSAHERRVELLPALIQEAENLSWTLFGLQYWPRRRDAKRRRELVLRVANLALRSICVGQSHAGVAIDRALRAFPHAVLLHAARTCTLLAERRPEGRASLLRYARQRVCGVRFENLVFYQLHKMPKTPGISRIIGEVETLLDCLPPSAAELKRVRLRLQLLADADIEALAVDLRGQSKPPAPSGTSANETQSKKLFGLSDLKIPMIGPSISRIEAKLRRAALRWRHNYARRLRSAELRQIYELSLPAHIWQLTEIARRLIRHGHVDIAICELDAGLMIFPGSALLNALRACAGMIANRPSGPEILQRYRGKSVNGMRWEELVFDQLYRVRRAPCTGSKIIGDVETILGCARPSARERRNVRISILHAATGMFPSSIDDKAEEARKQNTTATPSAAFHPPIAAFGFVVANMFRNCGDYHRALRFYFLRLDRCLIPPLPRLKKARGRLRDNKAYALCCISQVAWRLLHRGDFEAVLSAADRALMIFPDSGNLHACRAAALMFLDRPDEAVAIYHRLLAAGPDGTLIVQATFDALGAGGYSHPAIEQIRVQLASAGAKKA